MFALIRQIYDGISERLTDSYYGRKIMAAYLSYGAEYDFCRFYSCDSPDGRKGTAHVYYSSVVVDGYIDPEDMEFFMQMLQPTGIEIPRDCPINADGFKANHRTLFRVKKGDTDISFGDVAVNRQISDCYNILWESFDNMADFENWYVDISHRIRHKTAELYLFGSTTVTKDFDIDGFAFLSHIATAESERGKGAARRLLYCIAAELEAEGKNGYLFALDHRRSFYEAIGFEAADEDIFYEAVCG